MAHGMTASMSMFMMVGGLLRIVHAGVALEPLVFECIRWVAVVASASTGGSEGWVVCASGHGAVIAIVCVAIAIAIGVAIGVGIRVIAIAVLCRDEVEALEVGVVFAVVCGTARLQS
jgi:hypothetical protein